MFVKIQDVKIYYESYGSGTPMILIHGHGESTYIWRYMVDILAKKFSVYALDLKGFGNSDKPLDGDYSISSMSSLIINFMDNLQIQKAILVCHSFAGKIGVYTIIKRPKRILGLVLLGSAIGKFKIWNSFKIMQNKKIGEKIMNSFKEKKNVRMLLERLHDKTYEISDKEIEDYMKIARDKAAINAFLEYFIDFMKEDNYFKYLENINVPTLIIWGRNDNFISVDHGEIISEKIRNSKLEILENCGHDISEDQPKQVSQLLFEFFSDF
ncbi:MAG: alpha/beta fold hydrolase [Candidatus Odinarchaeota archaeon]